MYVRDYKPPTREPIKTQNMKYAIQGVPEELSEPPQERMQYNNGMYEMPGNDENINWGTLSNDRRVVAFHPPRARAPKKVDYTDTDFRAALEEARKR